MTYPYPPLTTHTASQSTPLVRPLQLTPHPAPLPLTSVPRPSTMFNMYSPLPQTTVIPQVNSPVQTRSPYPQLPSPMSISPSHLPSSTAYPVVQNQSPLIPATGFIPLKPPPSTSGQFTFQPHRAPTTPSFGPLAQNLQPPMNMGAAPPRLPIYANPNLVHAGVPPRPPIYGNPSPVNTVVPPRLPIYGNASALIQAHGQHVQSHNMVVHSPVFAGPSRPIKRETDPEYEDLMASVGVK